MSLTIPFKKNDENSYLSIYIEILEHISRLDVENILNNAKINYSLIPSLSKKENIMIYIEKKNYDKNKSKVLNKIFLQYTETLEIKMN